MKLRVIATLVAVLAFGVGSASAQSIGIFADPGSASCNITTPLYATTSMYVNVVGSGVLVPSGVNGAEFKVLHSIVGGTDAIITVIANPASNVALGDPMGAGCNIAFPGCQAGGSVNLYEIQLFTLAPGNPGMNGLIGIGAHTSPSNPNFDCALINKCDAPTFTSVCVATGEAQLNGVDTCTVAVEETSWSTVKGLFN